MKIALNFFWGLLLGLGLVISGMVDPTKVQNFLHFLPEWDPSLAFVMGGGILAALPMFTWAKKRTKTFLGESFQWPTNTLIFDPKLIMGSAIFGIGWGLGGICPGPGLVIAGFGNTNGILFVVTMLIGMVIHDKLLAKN